MIDYDSFSRCHLTDIFFPFSSGSKRVNKGCFKLLPRLVQLLDKHPNTNYTTVTDDIVEHIDTIKII